MPAAPPGSMITTVRDGSGNDIFVVYQFWDPATFVLRDQTQLTSVGNRTGALIVDNLTGKTQTVTVTSDTGVVKTFSVPSTGAALSAAQLAANKNNNGGPINTIQDLSGLTTLPL